MVPLASMSWWTHNVWRDFRRVLCFKMFQNCRHLSDQCCLDRYSLYSGRTRTERVWLCIGVVIAVALGGTVCTTRLPPSLLEQISLQNLTTTADCILDGSRSTVLDDIASDTVDDAKDHSALGEAPTLNVRTTCQDAHGEQTLFKESAHLICIELLQSLDGHMKICWGKSCGMR